MRRRAILVLFSALVIVAGMRSGHVVMGALIGALGLIGALAWRTR